MSMCLPNYRIPTEVSVGMRFHVRTPLSSSVEKTVSAF